MSVRRIRICLWSVAVIATAASGVTAWWAWQAPYRLAGEGDVNRAAHATQIERPSIPELELAALRPLWSLNLQRPLYDPEPQATREERFQPPPLRLRLLGTVIEPGNTQAILRAADGSIVFARVGQTIDEATIDVIEDTLVELTYYDEPHTLEVDTPQ